MFLIILILLALAIYGASSDSVFTAAPDPQSPTAGQAVTVTPGMIGTWIKDSAVELYNSASGLEVRPLAAHASGCTQSLLDPAKVQELITALPQPHSTTLAKLMDMSAGAWTAQAYSGPLGTGLCLPMQSKLVVIPGLDTTWLTTP